MSISAAEVAQGFQDANTTRYLTAAGFVMLLYDHALAISDERLYLWKAPPSFAKYAFILNRYLVPSLLLSVANEMCGFNGYLWTDSGCRRFLSALSMLSTVSIATANILILLRVMLLWKGNLQMKMFLYSVCGASICAFFSMMLLTVIKISPGIQWNPYVKMCITTTKTPSMIATWAAPLIFDLAALAAVVWNTISSPRSAQIPFTQALRTDGIIFFLAVVTLQICNMIFATIARPSLCLMTVFFVWSTVTMILNRSLIRMRKVEVKENQYPSTPIFGRAMSPFGLPSSADDWEMSDISDHETILKFRSH